MWESGLRVSELVAWEMRFGEGDDLGSLLDYEIAEERRKVDNKDYSSISELSCRFEGVDIGDISSSGLLTD